ncbi:MAG: tyrosine-type recombinase/integrase [Gammaproteobacteria bacterium]|nr:tyrosine-type recombinase/integrase [Gammaproteobacteria bacterium]
MRAMSRRLHRLPEAVIPAERPIAVVVVLAKTTRTPETDRPPEAEATPDKVLPHLDFDLAVRLFDDAAMAENTRNKYVGALRRYESWLDGRSPTDRLLADYLGVMYDRGLAPPSAVTAVAAVKRAALESARAGYEIAEHPAGGLAAQRRERFRREGAGRGRGQARPLRWEDADEMCEHAEANDDPRGFRDAALIGVISSALLRIAEASALDAGDVSFQKDGSAHIEIHRSKTDQHGDGAVGHIVPAAAARLRKWMDTAGIESGPLFRPVPGRRIGETRLGAAAICGVIKRRAKQAGIARRVSGHSLRVGAAQSLVEEGASLVDVQVAGRWKSSSMPAYYVRNQEASRGAVARLRGGAGQADETDEKKVTEIACNTRNGGDNVG